MINVYVFITGHSLVPGFESVFTACALTEQGKWLAGAVSQNESQALIRCAQMARQKAKTMLSKPADVSVRDIREYAVLAALEKAFANMP